MIKNFVLETANAPGTALQVLLAGAAQGRQPWAQAYTTGSPVFYFLDDGSQAEWGTGTFTTGAPNVIARDTVIGNTAGNTSRLLFAGAVNVYNEIPAERMLYVDNSGVARLPSGTILDPILGGTPVGASMDYWGPTAPAGWLFCNGLAVSRTTYARLFAVISTTFGAGNGSTTFNVPDCRGRVTAGRDAMGTGNIARLSGVFGANSDVLGYAWGDQWLMAHGHPMFISDPGHAHAVFDPGHLHFDAGHAHGYTFGFITPGNLLAGGASWGQTQPGGVTGIGVANIQAAGTGIAIFASATGILGNGQGGGSSVANAGAGSAQNIQPTIMANRIIFAGA